ncbi:WD40/YVTN/BNR-like repeat-containing protein [Brevibacillus daliensis]|uniref:WD40/YVTN/BNR-like repeat-containing protein n=1 Tax=Brevibacillus daliensis TaxID=2892995 RepID=UPI001E2D5555|nr:hypothetical protein [Brevibacillus daliensis]
MKIFTLTKIGLTVGVLLLVSSCSTSPTKQESIEAATNQKEQQQKGKQEVKLAQITGELTYQDVLEKGGNVNAIALTPGNQHMWLSTHAGVFASANQGLWGVVSPDLENSIVKTLWFDPKSTDTIYAGGLGLCKVSRDGGKTWSDITNGLSKGFEMQSLIGAEIKGKTLLYGLVNKEGVYMSEDGGLNWTMELPLPATEGYDMDYSLEDMSLYVLTQDELLMAKQDDVEWQSIPVGTDSHVYSIASDKENDQLYAATDIAILEKNGREWEVFSDELPEKFIHISYGSKEYPLIAMGESAQIYVYSKNSWKKWE